MFSEEKLNFNLFRLLFFRLSKKNVDCLFVHDFIVPNFALRWLACGCFSLEIYLSIYLSNSYRLGHKKLIFFAANSRWIGKNNFTLVTKCATHIFLCTTQWFAFAHALFSNEFRWKCLCDIQLSVSKIIQCKEIETEAKNTQTYSHTRRERVRCVCVRVFSHYLSFFPSSRYRCLYCSHHLSNLCVSTFSNKHHKKTFTVTVCCWVHSNQGIHSQWQKERKRRKDNSTHSHMHHTSVWH